jgi:hypothetical protein
MLRLIAAVIVSTALAGLSGCSFGGSQPYKWRLNMFTPRTKDPIDRLRDEGYGYGNNKPRPSKPSEVDGF